MVAEGDCSGSDSANSQPVEQRIQPALIDVVVPSTGSDVLAPTASEGQLASVVARNAWYFVGQGLSSSSNFLLSVLVLSQSSPAEFATLSVVVTIYLFLVMLLRAAVGLPVTLLYSKDLGIGHEEEFRAAAGVTFAASMATTGALALGALVSAGYRGQLLVLGAMVPLLLLQDTARYALFASARPRAAAEADGLWVLLQVLGSAVVLALVDGSASATALVGAWAGAGALSGCFLLRRIKMRPSLVSGLRWLGAHRGLTRRLVTEYLVGAGSHYAVFFGLAMVSGSHELGRLKAAQTFMGPVIIILLGGTVFGVPESVRAGADRARLLRLTLRLGGGLVGASIACGVIVYAMLPIAGPATFPDAWRSARPVIPLLTAFAAAVGASTGAMSGLRAIGQNTWLLRVRCVTGPLLVLGSIPGSAVFGVNGALAMLALVEWTVALWSWRRLRRLLPVG